MLKKLKNWIINIILDSPKIRSFSIKLVDIAVSRNMANHYPVVAMPKSSSSFISLVLAKVFGMDYVYQFCSGHSSEDDFDYEQIIHALIAQKQKTVGQYHMRATKRNIELLKRFNMKIILVTRNLADAVLSLHDHIVANSNQEGDTYTFAFLTKLNTSKFLSLSKEERCDFIIDHYLPWYINFYCSWVIALQNDQGLKNNVLHLTYEEIQKDNEKALIKILDFYEHDFSPIKLKEIIKETKGAKTRLNKGLTGRGLQELSVSHQKKIKKLIDDVATQYVFNLNDLWLEKKDAAKLHALFYHHYIDKII